ncbi:MAG: glycosyltransferase family 4 protein [Mycobacteriaceae bacterium]
MAVRRAGDPNRHRLVEPAALAALVERVRPDVLDLHEEPFSSITHQVLGVVPGQLPVVGYTAQNLDKRFPPPFARWEQAALRRLGGLYPCSHQAASVAVGKGFTGPVRVLPLAPSSAMVPGQQDITKGPVQLLMVGRMVPEKGVLDAVETLAGLAAQVPTTLTLVGSGPAEGAARARAAELGVADALRVVGWVGAEELTRIYQRSHVLLAPSRTEASWVEQFGRMVVEARACGVVVVAYASGSLPEVVGEAGVLVAEGDHEGMRAACFALHARPHRWVQLRSAGLAAHRSWDDVAAEQVELYTEAAARPTGQRPLRPARVTARAHWGPPAGDGRRFALPVLRKNPPGAALLARALDAVAARERPDEP